MIWAITTLFLITFLINLPMTRKPLSEDDGNWFYPAVFRNKGVKLYKNYFWCYGYFNIHWLVANIYNLFRIKKLAFFYYLKVIWYSLTSVSIYWITYCFWNNNSLSFISGLIFAIVVATPNTLFMLTYGEHFFILPINLSIISAYYGISTGNPLFFIIAGLSSAWAFQIKPTALLFCLCLPCSFYFFPNCLTTIGIFSFAFMFLNLIPILITRKRSVFRPGQPDQQYSGHKRYLSSIIEPAIALIVVYLDRLQIRTFNPLIDKLLNWLLYNQDSKYRKVAIKSYTKNNEIHKTGYTRNLHDNSFSVQIESCKRLIMPAINDLRLILILASIQIFLLFFYFDRFCFSMTVLFVVLLLMQQLQKNYYTPHFNPCWVPISILAAKTVMDTWPYLFKDGYLRYAIVVMILFMGFELFKITRIIIKSFSKKEKNTIGFMGWELGVLYRLAETAGKYIQEHSNENDKLFVWGNMPSVYLYAKREIFLTAHMFVYTHQEKAFEEEQLLMYLRYLPPEFLIFFNSKMNDQWNIERLQNAIGIPYVLMETFKITAHGKTMKTLEGISLEFPLYRRDDNLYKEILLDRALNAENLNDGVAYEKTLERILEIPPTSYEASIRLYMLKNNIDDEDSTRSFLKMKLPESHNDLEKTILLRMQAEIDIDTGDLDSAIKNYEKALDSNLNDFRVYNGLGELSFSMDRIDDAFEYFKKAIALQPYSSDVLNNIGVLLSQSGERDNAIKYFQKALSFMPSHPDARKNMEALT